MSNQKFTLRRNLLFPILIFSLYLLGLGIQIFHHEVWMDESHHWLLAKSSESLKELISNYRYDGHPIIWEIILYLISKFSDNVLAFQLVNGLFMAFASFLLLRYSPFPIWFRCLMLFSYFFFFEYGVISRNYSVLVFSLFLSINYLKKEQLNLAIIGASILANTHLFGLLYSLFIVATISIESKKARNLKPYRYAICFYLLSCLFAVYIIIPPLDHPIISNIVNHFDFNYLADCIMFFFKACFPIPDILNEHFWNTNIFTSQLKWIIAPFAILIWIVPFFFPWKKKFYLKTWYLLAIVILLISSYLGLILSTRYGGVLVIFLLGHIWLDYDKKNWKIESFTSIQKTIILTIIPFFLVCQITSAIIYGYTTVTSEFSGTKQTAKQIVDNGYKHLHIASDAFCAVIGVRNYIDKPIYSIKQKREFNFCEWNEMLLNNMKLSHNNKINIAKAYMENNNIDSLLYIQRSGSKEKLLENTGLPLIIEKLSHIDNKTPLLRYENFEILLITKL